MHFVALRMLTGDRAKYFGLVFAVAFGSILLENQASLFANNVRRTARQLLDITHANVWVMEPQTVDWVRSVGIAEASPPFASLPVMHTRYTEAVGFVGRERTQLSFLIARPAPGVTPKELTARIEKQTGLRARTTREFMWDCVRYYLRNTGIPVNFGITIGVALVVGTVVAGQTFYLFTVDNLKQFGALKAIGVTNLRLTGIILLHAFSVGVLGFALGTGMAAPFFELTLHQLETRGVSLMWQSVGITGACIFFVVIVASVLSIRR